MTVEDLFWLMLVTAIVSAGIAIGFGRKRRWFPCGVAIALSVISALIVLEGGPPV